MEDWLRRSGAVGLDSLELSDFPVTGRGLKALRRFAKGETILTIPSSVLWTVEGAYGDALLGPALRSVQPPLSDEDVLAIYLLFVRSRESGYEGPKSHLAAIPTTYSSSIFFSETDLEVCLGTSLYNVTRHLEDRIKEDHRSLVRRLFIQDQVLFPLEKFSIQDVSCISHKLYNFS